MNSTTLSLVVLAACATCALCALGGLIPAPSGCTYDGKKYHDGESFDLGPCMHCWCSDSTSDRAACAITDCMPPTCVDQVHDPKQCCATCPNGANCKHTDGTVIKKGESYSPDANTVCKCPENTFGFSSLTAMCVHTVA